MNRFPLSREAAIAAIAAVGVAANLAFPATGSAQQHGHGEHDHARHHEASGVALSVHEDAGAGMMIVRLGPLDLPAESDHYAVAQPPELFLPIEFDGWLLAYHPRLVEAGGAPVPGKLLHHVAFWNTSRPDFLCPNKEEHIFGAGGEMNDWTAVPGFGYRVTAGDRIRVSTMFHNPTATSYPETYLEVGVEYVRDGAGAPPRSVYPVWFDVQECGSSDYDLEPGENVTTGDHTVPYAGRLLGVGGHLHDYGTGLRLESVTRGVPIASVDPETDAHGKLVSMPIVPFFAQGGLPIAAGEVLRATATYDNRTGKKLPEGAMGIVVGYFLPDDDAPFKAMRRHPGH